ncbi:hypothetical protein ZWY2020_026936 [Hordeum vulgare]|nr:hypothetical protein ZWY2020_026936 [Hordeum vulgare]
MAAASSSAALQDPVSLNDKAAAMGGSVDGDRAAGDCGVCAICLGRSAQETLVKAATTPSQPPPSPAHETSARTAATSRFARSPIPRTSPSSPAPL